MSTITTEGNDKLEVITIDNITGEGTDDLRLEIDSKYCSAWIHLGEEEVRQLRDELNEWLNE
jgi:hypothetical protein